MEVYLGFRVQGLGSENHNSIPSKPSFNGAHVDNLFEPSKLPRGANKLYTDVVTAERNFMSSGVSKRMKLVRRLDWIRETQTLFRGIDSI